MTHAGSRPNWRIAAQSVRGASHQRSGAPNQDAVRTTEVDGANAVVLAVADGHGDVRHHRSDRGSRYAVDAAATVLSTWLASTAGRSDAEVRRSARALPGQLVEGWRSRVHDDLRSDPPPLDADGSGRDAPEVLYGSTLVAAGVNERLAVFAQIGDGDILAVDEDNSVARLAAGRTDLPSHVTESLCQADAIDRFRIELLFFDNTDRPPLLLLSTDGYANSFVDERAFFKLGSDLKRNLERDGADRVAGQLEAWLSQTSEAGSGDDISLALLWAPAKLAAPKHRHRFRTTILSLGSVATVLILALLGVRLWLPAVWSELDVTRWPSRIAAFVQAETPAAAPPKPDPVPGETSGTVDKSGAPGARSKDDDGTGGEP
jgi:hypothetical protein